MSEFECRNGHFPAPSKILPGGYCPICHAKIIRMDGMSNSQLQRMDREWDHPVEQEEEHDDES